jgi:hypothetical protein
MPVVRTHALLRPGRAARRGIKLFKETQRPLPCHSEWPGRSDQSRTSCGPRSNQKADSPRPQPLHSVLTNKTGACCKRAFTASVDFADDHGGCACRMLGAPSFWPPTLKNFAERHPIKMGPIH